MSKKSAHNRFKEKWRKTLLFSIILSVVAHVLIFTLWPSAHIERLPIAKSEEVHLIRPSVPEVSIPEAPQAVSRPAVPEVPEIEVDEDITIKPTNFEDNPVPELPPPPDIKETKRPVFIPKSIDPYLKNEAEVVEALQENYPDHLLRQEIGATVVIRFLVEKDGEISKAKVYKSSGYDSLDKAALSVVHVFDFNPGINRDKPIDAWVQIGIQFVPGR